MSHPRHVTVLLELDGLQEISELRGRRVVGRRIGHQREAAVSGAQKMNAQRRKTRSYLFAHDTTRGVLHEAGGGATPRASPPLCAPEVGHTSGFTAAAGCPRWGHHGEARGVPHPLLCAGYRTHHTKRRPRLRALNLRNSSGFVHWRVEASPLLAPQLSW